MKTKTEDSEIFEDTQSQKTSSVKTDLVAEGCETEDPWTGDRDWRFTALRDRETVGKKIGDLRSS